MDKIKTVKIKLPDGSVSEETYTISVDARNVDMDNGKDLQDTIGTIDIDTDGNISEQLDYLNENINNLNIDIKKKAYFFNTVADMKNADLTVGDYACTLGYYTVNDSGASEYQIISGNYVDDGGLYHKLNNNLFAKLIIPNQIVPEQFGAYGDGVHDDTQAMQKALNYIGQKHLVLFIKNLYLVNDLVLYDHMTSNYTYNIKGAESIQTGVGSPSTKNGLITHSHVFKPEDGNNSKFITIHMEYLNIVNKTSSSEDTGSAVFHKMHLAFCNISHCALIGFYYIINGGSTGLNFESNYVKNTRKAVFRVDPDLTGETGFYDSVITNNYLNAVHSGSTFHGYYSKRKSILLDETRLGFGPDGRFSDNFCDYFTYFIDAGKTFTDGDTPTFSTRVGGLVVNNVFQNMLNMMGIGITLSGHYSNNYFNNFANCEIYNLPNSNGGPFSIATQQAELSDSGDPEEETSIPYRRFQNCTITNNSFANNTKNIYFTYQATGAGNKFLPGAMIIQNNTDGESAAAFDTRSVFACDYQDATFLSAVKIQMWDHICKPDVLSTNYKIVQNYKLNACQGCIAQFQDGIFIASYNSSRSYSWKKLIDFSQ